MYCQIGQILTQGVIGQDYLQLFASYEEWSCMYVTLPLPQLGLTELELTSCFQRALQSSYLL